MVFSGSNVTGLSDLNEWRKAMFKKISIKWLAIIFVLLLVLVVLVTLIDTKSVINQNRTFNSQLTDFDTSKVSLIVIYPKSKKEVTQLIKADKEWKVTVGKRSYTADENTVKNMLNSLITLKATRVAARDKSAWSQFEVTDSAATRVQLLSGKKITADIYIGKFSYKQPENNNPYMQQRGTMTSYVRVAGDKEVYAVEGILAMAFNREANDFRDHTLVKSQKENLTKLVFTKPDGTFNLSKQNNHWMLDGLLADSASVASYLSSIAWLNNSNFIDETLLTATSPDYTLTIEGDNIPQPIKIKAFRADTANGYAINSSLNEGSYFSAKASGLMDKIFVDKSKFFKGKK
jgi:hypothetical protein